LLRIGNAGKNRHQDNSPVTAAIGRRHTRVLNDGMKICKKASDIRSDWMKKIEDAHR